MDTPTHKYQTGSYRVLLFSKYGTKVADLDAGVTYMDALSIGRNAAASSSVGSFVIVRVVHNSLDGHPSTVRDLEEGEEVNV